MSSPMLPDLLVCIPRRLACCIVFDPYDNIYSSNSSSIRFTEVYSNTFEIIYTPTYRYILPEQYILYSAYIKSIIGRFNCFAILEWSN
jgi:hypothetical protein